MSVRGTKRGSGVRGDDAVAGPSGISKRRRTEPEDALWQLRPVSDLKMSAIYNRSASEAPAELFRKDLISAMKLPDSEPLTTSEYWIITDAWKQEWERGVQVPVNPDSLPAPKVKIIDIPMPSDFAPFKLPRDKYIHLCRDAHYQSDKHVLSTTPARAEAACVYDLDGADICWLKLFNAERARAGAAPVTEDQMERILEQLEVRIRDKLIKIVKSEEGLGIEYDENVICDVCRSPESEDGNEMVFCDSCNICVHQACYGITVIPSGQWLCRPCGDGVRPSCVLCPNLGGAMKCTPSGHKWAHVSCVLWIPEVSIGCAENMEPITKISSIPSSRWSLVCVLCRERKGACIQCSVKTCKTAYHVTCAFKHGLEMRAIIEDENADDGVKLRSYCQKHSVNTRKGKTGSQSGSEEEEVKKKRRKDMTSEEKTQARAARWLEIESEFDRHISTKDISAHLLDMDEEAVTYIFNYWKIKRRAGHNRPLLTPKTDDNDLLAHRQEQADLDKMKMFVQLRQDLERVRNLCYMVSRREKLSRSFFRIREQTFHKQVQVLSIDPSISGPDLAAILEANHGPSIYDRLYSHPNAPDHKNDFDDLLARIAPQNSDEEKKKDRNGLVKGGKSSNPYKKHYVNGTRRSGSMYSGMSSEESAPEISRTTRYRGRAIGSSTDEDSKKPVSPKKKVSPKTKGKKSPKKTERKKKVPVSKAHIESSSEEEDVKPRIKKDVKKDRSRSKTLQQMEKEMTAGRFGQSGTDTDDDLITLKSTKNSKFSMDIYSDSSEEEPTSKLNIKSDSKGKHNKTKLEKVKSDSSHDIDSQQPLPRTKAAMKEFVPTQPEKKTPIKTEEKPAPKKRGRKPSNKEKKTPIKSNESDDEARNKENIKLSKQKDNPTDLIVPQRQAAKKASENMRSTTVVKKEDVVEKQPTVDESKPKPKVKSKGKEVKEDLPAKIGRKKSKELEKETIAYVPQRQAAKKAAAHIKIGMGSKPIAEANDGEKKKENEKEPSKTPPKKEESKSSKVPDKDSSSSSSTSSSSYSSSSSSDEVEEKHEMKPTAKAREIILPPRPSLFSPPGTRPTVDLPFLDKVSRPLSSTSASSDSESSKDSIYSGSSSPSPKRPRRRRKGKSQSTDVSPRKAPDKKLKTSEREPECRVPSSTPERKESSRPNDARAATRARTRSTTSIGNLPNKSDARSRKPSKDDTYNSTPSNKTSKESFQSSELPTPERKADEAIKRNAKDMSSPLQNTKREVELKANRKSRSESFDDKDNIKQEFDTPLRISPRKSTDLKTKSAAPRRASLKVPDRFKDLIKNKTSAESRHQQKKKDRRMSRQEMESSVTPEHFKRSPVKKSSVDKPTKDLVDKKRSPQIINSLPDDTSAKHWLPLAPSPNVHPPPIEKPGDHEKYMTEDKSLDSDSADKNSHKMIAKIQATLNENTMIRSPKTPMDARTITMEAMDIENPMARGVRKRSVLDTENKFMTQDSSHLQGVEISKSAKIPSTATRSMFSPKGNEFFEFDILEEGFNHDDVIKPFTTTNTYNELFFKEDSKEQGVQETLNLVDRLRMQLPMISKKMPAENSLQNELDAEDKMQKDDNSIASLRQSPVCDKMNAVDLPTSHEVSHPPRMNESPRDSTSDGKDERPISLTANEKWPMLTSSQSQSPEPHLERRKYEHTNTYQDEFKEPSTVQSDVQSVSEVGDTISLSKQSDDSQSLSVVDHSVHSNDQDLTQDNQNYENNNSVIHSDCATISSPFVNRETPKWAESKIATRRSSASSTDSDGSVCSQKTDLKSHHMNSCDTHRGNVIPEIDSYPPMPAYSCAVEPSMPLNQYTSNYSHQSPALYNTLGALPFFGAGPCGSQLTLPSPGPGLFSPGLPFTPTPLIQPLIKSAFPPTLCAAFTSSSQNLALTRAMISTPTPKPMDSPQDDIDVTGSDKFSIHVASSPSISVDSYEASNRPSTKMSNDSNEPTASVTSAETKSSPKPAKATPKFSGKSPGKSPGMSPKQNEAQKGSKKGSNKTNKSHRGRGRPKSRAQGNQGFPPTDYVRNSIASQLVGTVYDFDKEIANDGVDLKALRERRKSIDDRKSEHSYKDASQSPRGVSPQQTKRIAPVETKEVKPPTPESRERSASPAAEKTSSDRGPGFTQVQPVLPGPVDMRTYHPFENPAPVAGDGIHSHLLAFASGTADQQLTEIDEDLEKQLHSELASGRKAVPGSQSQPSIAKPIEPVKESFTPQLPKVSLSDSRNQLKVKIKGPFLDANYSTSSSQVAVPQPPVPVHEPGSNVFGSSSSTATSMVAGSTNLRRMRKKELLRQYWIQDMNMDPTNATTMGAAPPPAAPPPLTRAVITIPKAVASMTSIPTREDYKIIETPLEKKKRKMTSGLSRELRHLEVSMNDDDMKLSSFATPSIQAHKRRGRVSSKPNKNATMPLAPKLKIKLGANIVQQVPEEPLGCQFRPPKKRLSMAPAPKPSLEDLRRESMKYRRMVMADFEETEKVKKSKPSKSEKRKKKKEKKADKLRVINSKSDSANKLIIKIKRTTEQESGAAASGPSGAVAAAAAEPPADPFEYDPSAPDPLAIDPPSYAEASSAMRKIRTAKVTPIRLKLARSSQGSGYDVMPPPGAGGEQRAPAPAAAAAPPAVEDAQAISKHCEVR